MTLRDWWSRVVRTGVGWSGNKEFGKIKWYLVLNKQLMWFWCPQITQKINSLLKIKVTSLTSFAKTSQRLRQSCRMTVFQTHPNELQVQCLSVCLSPSVRRPVWMLLKMMRFSVERCAVIWQEYFVRQLRLITWMWDVWCCCCCCYKESLTANKKGWLSVMSAREANAEVGPIQYIQL